MKITKKFYEGYLNTLSIRDGDFPENDDHKIKTVRYGTWLRANDPIAFDVAYHNYTREQNKSVIQ